VWRFVVDAFHLRTRQPNEARPDIVVALDEDGFLGVIPESELENPTRAIREQLAYHEVEYGALRTLWASSFHLFEIEHVDLAPDVPGVNDPVYVHGRMFGPFPERGGETRFAEHGHLTLTRSELLASFVAGYRHAMRYEGNSAGGAGQCFHMLLPGDRVAALEVGEGLVLAYPLMPTDVTIRNAANDALVIQMVYLILSAIERELDVAVSTIPVPSRALVERLLRAEGFEIEGDLATRKREGILGFFFREKVALPAQGTLTDFAAAARRLLAHCERHPTARTAALATKWTFNPQHARSAGPNVAADELMFGRRYEEGILPRTGGFAPPPASTRQAAVSPPSVADEHEPEVPDIAALIAAARAAADKKR
jgi:hypothetical protein